MKDFIFKTNLGEQLVLQRGHDITEDESSNGIHPVVSSSGISYFIDNYTNEGPGVVLGRKGTVGSVHYLEENYWSHDTTLYVKDFKKNEPKYVYSFFKTITKKIQRLDAGSANPTLNRNHVYLLETYWHSKEAQKKICEILKIFDQLIITLENRKQVVDIFLSNLFKEFFCKKKVQNSKNSSRIYISDFINFKDGRTLTNTNRTLAADIPAFGANGIMGYSRTETGEGKTIFLGKIGSCGAINHCKGRFFATNNCFYIEESENKDFEFILQTLKLIDFERYIGGSSNPYMPLKNFKYHRVLVPDQSTLEHYKKVTDPFRDLFYMLDLQASKLKSFKNEIAIALVDNKINKEKIISIFDNVCNQ